jgi:ribose 1,5-bisphosphokinase
MAPEMYGCLYYVIGPSGSGKDSLMHYARQSLEQDALIVFAHRYITRPYNAGGENHVALSDAEFDARLANNLFSMHWRSHDTRYGIGCELEHWLLKGLTVVLNGSRAYLEQATQDFPRLVPMLIEVSPEVLRARLHARGRESNADIESRLLRAAEFGNIQHPGLLRFSNDAPLFETGPAFTELIRTRSGAAQCN